MDSGGGGSSFAKVKYAKARGRNSRKVVNPHVDVAAELGVSIFCCSNPRASRNMAEKQRRDNLNRNISEMAALLPIVAGSSRRMDKISILRLAAVFLRTQYSKFPQSVSSYHFDPIAGYILFSIIQYLR